jgi:hypothetical protein
LKYASSGGLKVTLPRSSQDVDLFRDPFGMASEDRDSRR